jgi:outer membrane cobalamin receptor
MERIEEKQSVGIIAMLTGRPCVPVKMNGGEGMNRPRDGI